MDKDGRLRRRRPEGPLRFRTSFRNTIYDVLKTRPGWVEAENDSDWDFQWAERDWVYDTFDSTHLDAWQRMNHFRNGRELCRKDLLAKNLKRQRRALEKEGKTEEAARYDFLPVTFILPGDYALFVEEFKRPAQAGATWIMKPVARSQGKGIFLFNKLAQIQQWKSDYRWKPDTAGVESYVVQRYLSNPYLVGGKKFDLRVYALVTSYAPLTVWVYRSGFTRFSASRYSNDTADLVNTYVHLTNVAVQKTSADYNPDFGGKWEIDRLKAYLACRHGTAAADKLFCDIQDIMILALAAVQKAIINDVHCFELYGYDIIVDDTLKPWLLEVNASPSMTASTPDDYDLKYKLLNDTLDVVDMECRLGPDDDRVGGFDLVWRDGPVKPTWVGAPSWLAAPGGVGVTSGVPPVFSGPTATCTYSNMMGAAFDRSINVFKHPGATKLTVATGAAAAASSGSSGGGAGGPPSAAPAPAPVPAPAAAATAASSAASSGDGKVVPGAARTGSGGKAAPAGGLLPAVPPSPGGGSSGGGSGGAPRAPR